MAQDQSDDVSLVNLPPSPGQRWWAIAVTACLLLGFGAVAPVATTPHVELNALFPALDSIVFVTDLVTAVLLFGQFSVIRAPALSVLATGYLFTAFIVVAHALTFTGAFTATGLFGAGLSTGSWIFLFWHLGFALALLGYATMSRERRTGDAVARRSPAAAILASTVAALALALGLAWLGINGDALLPTIILDRSRISPDVKYLVGAIIVVHAVGLGWLWARRRSALDYWLMVIALSAILELALSGIVPTVRFSLGFYAGRVFSLVTSSLVLIVLLMETTRLYVRLARSYARLQRERDSKLMSLEAVASSVVHELGQPLTAIRVSGAALKRLLRAVPPKLPDAQQVADDITQSAQLINDTLRNMRILFSRANTSPEPVDVNAVILDTLRTLDAELKSRRIVVRHALDAEIPVVLGNRGQLQQVFTNLVDNAIEAMAAVTDGPRVLSITTGRQGSGWLIAVVEDSGPGVAPESLGKIFEAFFTTKTRGMGLGLAICQRIVERHGGQLSAAAASPRGTVFQVALPQEHGPAPAARVSSG